MIFYILIVLVFIITFIIIYRTAELHDLFETIMFTFLIGGVINLFVTGILMLISVNIPQEYSMEKTKQYLSTVDGETLNGREYYLVRQNDLSGTSYLYVTVNKDGSLDPKTISSKIKIFEDEEEKPYVVKTEKSKKNVDNSWIVPFDARGKYSNWSNSVLEFHVPKKSTQYYQPVIVQEDQK